MGTDPADNHPTSRRLTVPWSRWTAAPMGRITTAATRSLEMAVEGFTLNNRISIGVMSAPPPAPVNPTRSPMTALPRRCTDPWRRHLPIGPVGAPNGAQLVAGLLRAGNGPYPPCPDPCPATYVVTPGARDGSARGDVESPGRFICWGGEVPCVVWR